MKLKIGILGTRGIPNRYGGYEQITTYLSQGLAAKGHDVTVYNSHNHVYQEKKFDNVNIQHCYDPEYRIGTAGQFIYDWNCIKNAYKKKFDIILFMGYTSSSIWGKFFPSQSIIISNMDGLEWKRAKYSKWVQRFLKKAESWAVKYSNYYIADSTAIENYLRNTYGIDSKYIPYAAHIYNTLNSQYLEEFGLQKDNYYLVIARMEPENNVEMIIKGFLVSNSDKKLVIVGNVSNKYGAYLQRKYAQNNIIFTGALFDQKSLHTLRHFCSLYFHGHSVGGTNPSLLEAMSSRALIAAHRNEFNVAILLDNAYYFESEADIAFILNYHHLEPVNWKENNFKKINEHFNWQNIIDQYDDFLCICFKVKNRQRPVKVKTSVHSRTTFVS